MIAPSGVNGALPVVYDPSADLDVATGLTYPTAVRQTITLLFAEPLPPGTYEITLSPNIQAASYSAGEAVAAGRRRLVRRPPAGVLADRGCPERCQCRRGEPRHTGRDHGQPEHDRQGTAFLTQLQNDMNALLNQLIIENGDDPSLTAELNNQILTWFVPLFASAAGSAIRRPSP